MLLLDGARRQRARNSLGPLAASPQPRVTVTSPRGRGDGTSECDGANGGGALTASSSTPSSQPLCIRKDHHALDRMQMTPTSSEPSHQPVPEGTSFIQPDASADPMLALGAAARRVSSLPQQQLLHNKGVPRCADPILLTSLEANYSPIQVNLALQPLTDSVTMFGKTQTTTHYSLAGTAILTLGSFHPSAPTLVELEQRGMGVHVKGIEVSFTGYSLYHDYVGRSTAIKLTEVKQQLLPLQGEHIPLSDILYPTQAQANRHAATVECAPTYRTLQDHSDKLQLEIQFDLAVPGCLPPSLRTAFGSTFYTLQAQVDFDISPLPTPIQHDVSVPNDTSFEPIDNATNWSALVSRTPASPTSVSAPNTPNGSRSKPFPPSSAASSSTVIPSWKTADSAPLASHLSSSQHTTHPATRDIFKTKSPVSSPAMIILLHRCRDVVPAPMARVVHGYLVGIPMDPPDPPSARSGGAHDPTEHAAPRAALPADQSAYPNPVPHQMGLTPATGPEASHATTTYHTTGSNNAAQPAQQETAMARPATNAHSISQRNFVQRFELQPPPDLVQAAKEKVREAQQLAAERGKEVDQPKVDSHYATTLPVRLALSVPSHVHTRGNSLGSLRFSIQLNLGKVGIWAQKYLRRNGGLRLRSMELTCTQMEKHR